MDQEEQKTEIFNTHFKPILEIMDEPGVTDIVVNRYDQIEKFRNGTKEATGRSFTNEAAFESALSYVANSQKINPPFGKGKVQFDAQLPGGHRICASHSLISRKGCSCTIRLHRLSSFKLNDYVDCGAFTKEMMEIVQNALKRHANIIFSGPTSTWKTTIMNALASTLPENLRILVGENSGEINLPQESALYLDEYENKEDGVDHTVYLIMLSFLRMRPDILVVGEIRFPNESAALYRALSTGHNGVLASVHARDRNALLDVLAENASSFNNISFDIIRNRLNQYIDVSVNMTRNENNQVKCNELILTKGGEVKRKIVYNEETNSFIEA